jgi:hypothetical protein
MILSHPIDGQDFTLPLWGIVIDDFGNQAAITLKGWQFDDGWKEYVVSSETMEHVYRPQEKE